MTAASAVSKPAFQFALPRGERPGPLAKRPSIAEFQFALPRGERRRGANFNRGRLLFQFALPRGERHSPRFCSMPL